jgi:tetratricopeptide (TPR) repeat protein
MEINRFAIVLVWLAAFGPSLAWSATARPGEDAAAEKPVEIRANTEKRHRFDEYPYREEYRNGATHVLGTIHGRVVWSSEKSPYVMDENVWVARDGTLTIEPGVVVQVVRIGERTSSIDAYVGLIVWGTLTAEGRPDQMIRFTAASEEPAKYREWQGLVLASSCSPSILKWTLVRDAIFGVDAYGPALIAHCVFRDCHTGIYLERGFVGDVVHNVSAHNQFSGIRCKATRAEATIINNICYENGGGIRAWGGVSAYADYNLYWFSGGGHHYSGIEAGDHDVCVNPGFSDVGADDFRLAETSPARGAGFEGADIGLFIRGWSEESARQENEAWSGGGARSLWYASLAISRDTRRLSEAQRNCEAALRKDAPSELKDKISCTLGHVLTLQKNYGLAKQTLEKVLSDSQFPHLRDLARRYLAEAWAKQRRPQEALAVLEGLQWPQSRVWAESAKAKYKAAAGAHEEALRTLEGLKDKEPDRYLKAVSEMVSNRAEANDIDGAVALLQGFVDYPLAKEIAGAYLSIARAVRAQGRFELAAELLAESCDIDRFSKEAPETLFLFAEILESDLHRPDDADAVRAELCTYYFPYNSHVMEAEKKLSNRARSTGADYRWSEHSGVYDKKILLDASLHESSIFDRYSAGSCNFGQYEVIRILSDAGYIAHVNSYQRFSGSKQGRRLTREIANRYDLIVCNGRYGGSAEPPIDEDIIENLAAYVRDGGSLLVVAAGSKLGSGKMAQFYNPLVEQFGIRFAENTSLTGSRGVVADHPAMQDPAMQGLTSFWPRTGVGVTVDQADVLGYVGDQPVIVVARYGKGKVMAAGLGSAFMGPSLGAGGSNKAEKIQDNTKLLINLVSYLLDS